MEAAGGAAEERDHVVYVPLETKLLLSSPA
jgi:hypothetical protein